MTDWLHWSATSQDIMDSGLALRLKSLLALWDARLVTLARALGQLAQTHAELPMAARTYGQSATPTSFGVVVASWGDQGPQVRAAPAAAFGRTDPGHSWHSERDSIAAFAAWMANLTASLGKMTEDLILLSQSGIAEVAIAGAGGSSIMPQKQTPVGPSVLVALARHGIGLSATLPGAALHRQQRDGAAWFTEWLTLPQLCVTTGRALALAIDLARRLAPNPDAMAAGLAAHGGLIRAEALTFALTRLMPRPEAAAVMALAAQVRAGQGDLITLACVRWPDLTLPQGLGSAPDQARAFAKFTLDLWQPALIGQSGIIFGHQPLRRG